MYKGQTFSEALHYEPLTRLHYETIAEQIAPSETHLDFTTFENSIFTQKQTLVKLLG